jgi:hypothetical protein
MTTFDPQQLQQLLLLVYTHPLGPRSHDTNPQKSMVLLTVIEHAQRNASTWLKAGEARRNTHKSHSSSAVQPSTQLS